MYYFLGPLSNADATTTLSGKYPFTFVPRLLPGQKLFDQDQLDTSFDGSHKTSSAAALNYRFRKRVSQGRLIQQQQQQQQQQNAIATKGSSSLGWTTTTLQSSPIKNNHSLIGTDKNASNKNNDNESHVIFARHHAISMTMINWLQFIFNSVLTFLILYILFIVLWTLRHDFRIKTEEYTAGKKKEDFVELYINMFIISKCRFIY